MAFDPGKNVGRVSIRVVPDTTRFRRQLKRQLDVIERRTSMTVRVDKAHVDENAIRTSIQRQLDRINVSKGAEAEVKVKVREADVVKRDLHDSIQRQIDSFKSLRANLQAQIENKEEFERQVRRMVDRAERNEIDIPVSVMTSIAAARLAWLTRTRIVPIVAVVSDASIKRVAATFAALSGARLSWKWIDDLIDKFRDLDKNLPSILGWTSALTALGAGIMASVSGLVGIGQGLFSILPAFLTVPGLIINAAGSVTVLIVALKHASEELSVLKADMNELGDIIRTTFWDHAREPIVNLVQGLMPQLRNSFRELSTGVGVFTAALADAFGDELGGGRLEGIFAGIAEGWRILATGASGFAGAIVSLSEIAAKYTPRLAAWFVRQANTFDSWLTSIATDGRLDAWMEGAIDSMYDLWDATKGVAGVFSGIWRAANAAGSGGLKGFAQMMQDWKRIVNSADFQRGLEAVFRGSYAAMDAFGGAIQSLGRLIGDMPSQFERFVGSVGGFLGGVFDAAFQALNNNAFKIGLDEFSRGLDAALKGIKPALDPIAQTFGNFLGLLGDLATHVLPTAAGVLGNLMPTIDALIKPVREALPGLTGAVDSFVRDVAPSIAKFAEALSPAVTSILSTLGDTLRDIGPDVAALVDAMSPALVGAMNALAEALKPFAEVVKFLYGVVSAGFDALKDPSWFWDDKTLNKVVGGIIDRGGPIADIFKWAQDVDKEFAEAGKKHANSYTRSLSSGINASDVAGLVSRWTSLITNEFNTKGKAAGNNLWKQFISSDMPPEVIQGVRSNLEKLGVEFQERGRLGGFGFSRGAGAGFNSSFPGTASSMRSTIAGSIPTGMLYNIGWQVSQGLANGILANRYAVIRAANSVANSIPAATRFALRIASPSKRMADEVGRWVPAGIAQGIDKHAHLVKRSAEAAVDFDLFDGRRQAPAAAGAQKVVNLHWHNPVARDPMKEAMEARDLAEAVM